MGHICNNTDIAQLHSIIIRHISFIVQQDRLDVYVQSHRHILVAASLPEAYFLSY